MQSFTLRSFPKAILHIDGDSFFASCEVAKNPSLRGKPVVTGKERGIASSMTYEAKARGVTRGMQIREILKVCPDAIILPSDYETYSLYSKRMFEIVKRYTPEVDEYSIDECFADITGFRSYHGMSYEQIATQIKKELDEELGMTFSVGLGVNKVTAKIGSKWKKPNGFTSIPGHSLHLYLAKLPIEKVWGIGPNTSEFLKRFKILTALDFALCTEDFVTSKLNKPYQEIWRELRGEFVYPLNTVEKHDYKSISKTKTFTPPSSSRSFVFSQLSKNIESACIKLRRHELVTNSVFFFLKTQDMKTKGVELKFSIPTSVPQDIIQAVSERFDEVYTSKKLYRATGIALMKLTHSTGLQMDLFGKTLRVEEISTIYKYIDKVAQKYGKHTLFLGSSMEAMKNQQHNGDRGDIPERKLQLFKGETARKRLGIISLGKVH